MGVATTVVPKGLGTRPESCPNGCTFWVNRYLGKLFQKIPGLTTPLLI